MMEFLDCPSCGNKKFLVSILAGGWAHLTCDCGWSGRAQRNTKIKEPKALVTSKSREACLLFASGKNYKEIGKILGINAGAVKDRINRAVWNLFSDPKSRRPPLFGCAYTTKDGELSYWEPELLKARTEWESFFREKLQ